MAQKPETVFRRRISRYLYALPNTSVHPIDQSSIRGDMDFILCIRGRFVALELKAEQGKLAGLQLYKINKINHTAMGIAIEVRPETWEEIYLFLKKLAKGEFENDPSYIQNFARGRVLNSVRKADGPA